MGAKNSHQENGNDVSRRNQRQNRNQRLPSFPQEQYKPDPLCSNVQVIQEQQQQLQKQNLEKQQRQQQLQQARAKLCRQFRIHNGEQNYGYDVIFSGLLDSKVRSVEVDDPYIKNVGQITNFTQFCELLVRNCQNLRMISLRTKQNEKGSTKEQQNRLDLLRDSLVDHGVTLIVEYSTTLHDREIRFDTGWVVTLGRGLDYFQPKYDRFKIGGFDLNLRQCRETTITIFHRDSVGLNRH